MQTVFNYKNRTQRYRTVGQRSREYAFSVCRVRNRSELDLSRSRITCLVFNHANIHLSTVTDFFSESFACFVDVLWRKLALAFNVVRIML